MHDHATIILRRGDQRRGRQLSKRALERQRHDVQELLLKDRRYLLPDSIFQIDKKRAAERVLVAEVRQRGGYCVVGYIAWDIRTVTYYDVTRKRDMSCRVVVLRSLVVHEDYQHSMIALRLSREAELLGTIEAVQLGDGFPAIGTVGFIHADNEPALKWAGRMGWRVRLHGVNDLELTSHPAAECVALLGLELAKEVQDAPFVIAFVNRLELIDAARFHVIGTLPYDLREEVEALRVDYDIPDVLGRAALKTSRDIVKQDPVAMAAFALVGGWDDTLFGPLPRPEMIRGFDGNPTPPPRAVKPALRRKAA